MAASSKSSSKSSAGAIIALLVALASVAVLLYLPLRKGKPFAIVVGVIGILGGLSCICWWVMTHENPPSELKVLAAFSGAIYLVGLALRVFGGREGVVPVSSSALNLGSREVVLYETPARFFGEKRVRAFGGLGFRLGRRVGTGVGLSVPIPLTVVVDEGSIVITNRRVIMAGAKGTVSVKARNLLDVAAQGDHLVVRPESGRVLVAEVSNPSDASMAIRSAMELAS